MYSDKKESNRHSHNRLSQDHKFISAKSSNKPSPTNRTSNLLFSAFNVNNNKSDTNSPHSDSFRNEKLFMLLNNDGNLNKFILYVFIKLNRRLERNEDSLYI